MAEEMSLIEDDEGRTSLLTSGGMGGINGGRGYTAQTRYIACHAPCWIFEPGFTKIWPEGAGDVDVYFDEAPEPYAEHIQLKNYAYNITPGSLKAIISTFVALDQGGREIYYRKYTVAARSVNPQVETLRLRLERWRNAPSQALTDTEAQDLNSAIESVGLSSHADWVKEKLYFHINPFDLSDDSICFNQFAGTLLHRFENHPIYRKRLLPGRRAAYDRMLSSIDASPGKTIDTKSLLGIVETAFSAEVGDGVNLIIHNWELQTQDLGDHQVYEYDWTHYFDRNVSPRVVPDANVWNNKFVKEIQFLKQKLINEKSSSFVRFRGRCALSMGFAVGATFPQTGGWTIEIPQPDIANLWQTNPSISSDYQLVTRLLGPEDGIELNPNSTDLLVIASVTQSNTGNVARYINSRFAPTSSFKAIVEVQPKGGARSGSIQGATDAADFAIALRDLIKKQNDLHGTFAVHLFYNGPQALSAMLGHWLTSVNTIHLYEFLQPNGPGLPLFAPTCILPT
jgi:hypothetical protein